MLQPSFFNSVFVFPILNVLVAFYQLFVQLGVPGAMGFAIIALTVAIRLILHPFFSKQMEAGTKMQELKPQLDALSKKYKGDKKKLQEEQMRLYQEAGINPASSCLFVILQIPVFIALYQTLQLFFVADKTAVITAINRVLYFPALKLSSLQLDFFGVNLAVTPEGAKNIFFMAIPLITGVLQYFQTQVTMPASQPVIPTGDSKTAGEKKDDAGDFQKAMNMQMKFIFPVMIGWFSLRMPVGLSLYWNIFSLFSIIQYVLHKRQKKS